MNQQTTDKRNDRSRREIDRIIRERGLRVEPHGPHAWRIVGPGTDILLRDWRTVTAFDLRPVL